MKRHIPSGEAVVCFWRRRTIPLREEQEEKMYFVGSSYNFRHSQAQLTVQEWWRSVKRSPIWKYHLYPARRHFWKCISSVWMSLCADYYCLPDCMPPLLVLALLTDLAFVCVQSVEYPIHTLATSIVKMLCLVSIGGWIFDVVQNFSSLIDRRIRIS